MAQFGLAGLVALAIVGAAAAVLLNRAGTSVAISDSRRLTGLLADEIVEPVLTDELLRREPAAVAAMDRVVKGRILGPAVVRVKVWNARGRIIYSDEHRLIGARFDLGADERATIRTGMVAAAVSDLTEPENRFERSQGKLLEVYHRVRAPDGSPLLFEAYLPFRFVNETAHSVWRSFLPALLAALVVLALLQLPLGWSLARRLRDRQREREILLHRAIDASHAERRRIASDLHDGVVQDLAGLSFGLAAAADRAPAAADSGVQRALREGSRDARQALRRLRTALVQIHPPDLHRAGLGQALSDLLSPLRTAGIDATLQVDEALELDPEIERLMFRGAQEALRNITEHADARSVRVTLTGGPHVARLDVADDGSGFTEEERTRRMERGHIGLQLLEGLVAQAGGTLVVRSSTGEGTRFVLELPG